MIYKVYESGFQIFEGTVEQYDDCFGVYIGCTLEDMQKGRRISWLDHGGKL